jgi:hypothetical protein
MDAYVWILVISIFADWRFDESRTRGLTEAACLTLIQEVQSQTTRAYCYKDGEPDPGWPKRPITREICAYHACWPLLPGRRRV